MLNLSRVIDNSNNYNFLKYQSIFKKLLPMERSLCYKTNARSAKFTPGGLNINVNNFISAIIEILKMKLRRITLSAKVMKMPTECKRTYIILDLLQSIDGITSLKSWNILMKMLVALILIVDDENNTPSPSSFFNFFCLHGADLG